MNYLQIITDNNLICKYIEKFEFYAGLFKPDVLQFFMNCIIFYRISLTGNEYVLANFVSKIYHIGYNNNMDHYIFLNKINTLDDCFLISTNKVLKITNYGN